MTINFGRFLIFCLFALAGVVVFPYIDRYLNPGTSAPGMISMLGTGITLSLFVVVSIWYGISSQMKLSYTFLLYVFIYNLFIILAKFVLAPSSMYLANSHYTFPGGLSIFGLGSGNFLVLSLSAIVIFICYFVFFFLLYKIYSRKVTKALQSTPQQRKRITSHIGVAVIGLIFLSVFVSFLIFSGFWIFIILPVLSSEQYFAIIFSTVLGFFLAASILSAILFVSAAFHSVAAQAVFLKKAAFLSSFFWVGLVFLIAFHALWIVYLLVLMNLWPLKVIVPK